MARRRMAYMVIIPALALFFFFHTFPALQGVFYSFTNSRGYGTWDFVGLDNYIKLFQDPNVLHAYGFTFLYAFIATLLTNVVSMLIALGLSSNIMMRGLIRGVFFLPAVLPIIVVGFVFNFIFANVLPKLGIPGLETNILGDSSTAWIGIVIVGVWQACATTIVIYIAGLQTIPVDVIEASTLDGATATRRFFSIVLPLVMPFLMINMVLSLKNFLLVFDLVMAMTKGGPGTATQSVAFLIYRNGFAGGEFAYQSANAVIYFLVIALLSFVQVKFLGNKEEK